MGTFNNGLNFGKCFSRSVDQQNLSKVSKFTYLKGVLIDAAAAAISGIAIINDNYDLAVTMLRERFGRPDVTIESLNYKVSQSQLINLQKSVKHLNNLKRY